MQISTKRFFDRMIRQLFAVFFKLQIPAITWAILHREQIPKKYDTLLRSRFENKHYK